MGETKVLLKKFLMALAIALYSVVPVVAGDNDRARSHGQWHGAKMGNLKAHQQPAWGHLKKAHLGGLRASARDLRLTKERWRIAVQGSAGGEGLISRYKREYQLAIGRSLTPDQRPLMGVPSHRFPMDRSKGAGLHWDKGEGKGWGKGYGKNSNKRHGLGRDKGGKRGDKGAGMRWDKGEGKGWGKAYGKDSNKRYGMGGDKGAGKRGDRSRGDKWQKNGKKKYFDTD